MPGHGAGPIRRRREHASPIPFVIVTFAFTWTCWWLTALDALFNCGPDAPALLPSKRTAHVDERLAA